MNERKKILGTVDKINPSNIEVQETDIWKFMLGFEGEDKTPVNVLHCYIESKGATQTCAFFSGHSGLLNRLLAIVEQFNSRSEEEAEKCTR